MKSKLNMERCILDLTGRGDSRDFISLNDCFQNILTLGSTGSGKSSSSMASLALSLLNSQGLKSHEKVGMVVYLYKSSDVNDWLKWAYEQGREKDIIRIGAEHKNVLNLLEHYGKDEPMNAVECLMNLAGLTDGGGSSNQGEKFWIISQKIRLDRLIRLNQLSGEPLNINTLYQLHVSAPNEPEEALSEEFAQSSYFMQMMAKAAQRVGENHPNFKLVEQYFFSSFLNLNDRTASSILSMVDSILEPFISSKILNNLFCGSSTLDLHEVFKGKILLMDISVQRHRFVGRIAQIMLGYILKEEVQKRDLETHGNPLIFVLDECQNFLIPKNDSLFMSVSRSAKAGSILITQNDSNMLASIGNDGKAGEAQVNSIKALCNLKFFHAQNDPITNEFAAKTIGKTFIDLSSFSTNRQMGSSASSSKALHYVIEPRFFTMNLRKGGAEFDFIADAVVVGTGRKFSNDENFLKVSFRQHFAR